MPDGVFASPQVADCDWNNSNNYVGTHRQAWVIKLVADGLVEIGNSPLEITVINLP